MRLFGSNSPQPEPEPLTAEQRAAIRQRGQCLWCGGYHARACPRVRRMRWSPTRTEPVEVEYWADGEWSDEHIWWPEDLAE